jgi:MFS-type transporter involved in bile tolerance (Atg22 family)
VLVAVGAGFFSISTMNMVLSVMLKPMTEDLGWSRATLTGAGTLGVLAASLVSPFFGRVVDTRGPRFIASFSAAPIGLIFILPAGKDAVWQFYLLYSLGRVISFVRSRARAVGIT